MPKSGPEFNTKENPESASILYKRKSKTLFI
jgi:hypothetical protein